MEKIDHRIYWIWLAGRAGQASRTAVKLINAFGNAKNVYDASPEMLEGEEFGFVGKEKSQAIKILSDKSLDLAYQTLEDAERTSQHVIVPTDADYPKSLLSLRDAPMVLYVIGEFPDVNRELCVSVVGTRKMTDSGRRNAYAIGYGLASGGAVVVSGMALGGDGMALCGALSAGGRTVAVLGCGADVIYPKDHTDLYHAILKRGAVVSEYPPGTTPNGFHFPVRNRIISGLSAGSVVTEADSESGALITARHALYQGRNVFAVPGEVGLPGSVGPNDLIKNGAFVVTSAEDVLAEYEFLYPHSVSMRSFRRAMRELDVETASAEEMSKMRVSVKGGESYYGSGTYGGRSEWHGVNTDDLPKPPAVKRKDKRNAEKPVAMGRKAEPDETAAESVPSAHIELDLLDAVSVKVYNLMSPDVPMIPDELVKDGLSVSQVLSSLSLLELAGAVESGAGGYFLRRSSDDISFEIEE